ncbi:SGNH/GDSL hydrolase family protein [Saccharibacillus sp. CPCC 101409]|uniref:SGNH/GDSL hydrolase family protein n=1 Tax=Saccharibacillus sp. CPCC 101409 TaxID=3058041 RepID=UPI0026727022|nr:SGNH/GDSL hydrolase family protein [Saccharibacillus sp. CPCC 101409]MDO3410748.1 SGNH/GDSL hydrolase family protein [Saccharibacillus sp. CPCC 101409]
MKLVHRDKLLLIGDSVTDAGRGYPVGYGNGLGGGYAQLVDALLRTGYPELNTLVLNTGVSGNTVRDLKKRWQTDVLDHKPDWLAILIGINDVWRQFDTPESVQSFITPEEYEATLRELLDEAQPNLKGLILLTPYYMSGREDPMRSKMDRYGAVIKRLAGDYGAELVDTQAAFDRMGHHMILSSLSNGWDHVHPNAAGSMVIARGLLDALDFEWDRGRD